MELPVNPVLYWRTVLTIITPLVLIRDFSQNSFIIISNVKNIIQYPKKDFTFCEESCQHSSGREL